MHPVLFSLGALQIRSYSLLTALSMFVAIYFSRARAEKEGFKKGDILDLCLLVTVTSVAGARALYVITNWKEEFALKPILKVFKPWEGGLVFYGGFLTTVIILVLWNRYKRLDLIKFGDLGLPFLALAQSICRVGCFLNGCCYGVVSTAHGVIFPGTDAQPHLPVQLYESVFDFLNFLILMFFQGNKRRVKGDIFFLYVLNYGLIRFVLENFRADPDRGTILFLSTSMFISIFMILIGLTGLTWPRVSVRKTA